MCGKLGTQEACLDHLLNMLNESLSADPQQLTKLSKLRCITDQSGAGHLAFFDPRPRRTLPSSSIAGKFFSIAFFRYLSYF